MDQQKKKQIVVFDFDKTITSEHLYHELRKSDTSNTFNREWTINYIFGGEKRIESLMTFFGELIMSDIDLAISSHGNLDEIKKALSFAGIPLQIFVYIHAGSPSQLWKTSDPEFNTSQMFSTKVQFIEKQLQYKDKYNHVIFIDDDEPHGRSKYYKQLSLENRKFKRRVVTTIVMHNVDPHGIGKIEIENDNGMNENDYVSIWKAIEDFNSNFAQRGGGYKRNITQEHLPILKKKINFRKCKSCGEYF